MGFFCCIAVQCVNCYNKPMNTFNDFIERKQIISNVHYTFVFCPRYRRKIFNDDKVVHAFKTMVRGICQNLDVSCVSIRCESDYTVIQVRAISTISPHNIITKIKGGTSASIRDDFPDLSHLTSLWTRNYLVSTEDVTDEMIDTYVSQQKTRN